MSGNDIAQYVQVIDPVLLYRDEEYAAHVIDHHWHRAAQELVHLVMENVEHEDEINITLKIGKRTARNGEIAIVGAASGFNDGSFVREQERVSMDASALRREEP